jgi:hypothetical protein
MKQLMKYTDVQGMEGRRCSKQVLKWISQERGRGDDRELDGGKGISNEIVGKRLKGQNKKREG